PVLVAGTDVVLVAEGGALTVETVDAMAPVRARAFVSAGARRLGDGEVVAATSATPAPTPAIDAALAFTVAPARPPAASESEIVPDRRRLVLWRVHPAGPPLLATLVGDGNARVQVRSAGVGPAEL